MSIRRELKRLKKSGALDSSRTIRPDEAPEFVAAYPLLAGYFINRYGVMKPMEDLNEDDFASGAVEPSVIQPGAITPLRLRDGAFS